MLLEMKGAKRLQKDLKAIQLGFGKRLRAILQSCFY